MLRPVRLSSLRLKLAPLLATSLLLNYSPLAFAEEQSLDPAAPALEEHHSYSSVEKSVVQRYLKPNEYMPISEIKPGMEGYGLSVFQGTRIDKFNVKVIGVIKKVLNNRDAILVRMSGPGIAKNNVIKGMSGSPVYINGKLIGAISYGFDFSTEPIAGITPIVDMLDALAQDGTQASAVPDRISKLDLPSVSPSMMQTAGGSVPISVAGAAPHMIPLMSPVALSGFSSRAEKFLSEKFGDIGLNCSSGAAGAMDESLAEQTKTTSNPFAPGSAISVMLTTGDFNTAGLGTTTASFGGKVVAFGHPFLQAGAVDFPMASAYVHQIMPSLATSFKLGSPMKLYGSITSDRPWAIGGQVGRTAHTIPATYAVVDETRHMEHTYHCNIIDHPDLTPELIAATTMSAIDTTHQSSAPYILKVTSTIETTDGAIVHRWDRFPSHFSAHSNSLSTIARLKNSSDPVAGYLYYAATQIMDNEFKHESIKRIHLNIALEDGHNAARLERIYAENPVVEPGDTVKVNCVIRPYNKERVVKTIELRVPRNVPDGNIVLAVASGDEIDNVRRRVGLVDPPTENMDQVLNKLRNRGRGDALCALLALPEQSISVNGVTLLNPPAHWSKLFLSDRYTRGAVLSKGEIRSSQIESYLIDGAHVMTVEVRRKDKATSRPQPMVTANNNNANSVDAISMTDLARKTIGRIDSTAITTTSSSGTGVTSTVIQPQTAPQAAEKPVTPPPPSTPFWTSTSKRSPHMRTLQVWSQESEAEFRSGKTDATTIDSWGRKTAGFQSLGKTTIKNDMRIWSATYANRSFYFATTNKIFRWNSDTKAPELVAELDSVAIPSLVSDSHGTLFAACVPGSRVFAIDPNKPDRQNTTLVASLKEPLVTTLAIDKTDNLYIGVTGSGKVYKQKAGTNRTPAVVVFDSGQADITALFHCPSDGKLYIGTAEKGSVYSLDASGQVHAEYQTPDHIVTGVARDKQGNLFVATAGSGHLVKISEDGQVDTLATSDAFYTLIYNQSNDKVYAGDGEGDITEARFDPLSKQSYFVPVCHTEQDAVLALCSDNNGKLFSGTCSMPIAQVFDMKPATHASYTSEVRDGLRPSKWSRLRAFGGYNEVNDAIKRAITVDTRTGQTSQPDVSWSKWTEATASEEAYEIQSPPARYLQYRLTWKTDETAKGHPVAIGKVDVTYLPTNAAPQISQVSLKSGSAVHGKEEIIVNGTDSDGDNLMLAMQLSSDGGKSWQTVVNDLRSIKPAKESASTVADSTSTTEAIETGDAKKPTPVTPTPILVPKADEALPPQVPPPGGMPSQWTPEDVPQPAPTKVDKEFGDEVEKPADSSSLTKIELTSSSTKTAATAKKKTKGKAKPGPIAEGNTVTTSSDANGEKFTIKWDTTKFKEGNYIVRFTLDDKLSNADNSSQASVLRTINVDNTPPQIVSAKWIKGKSGAAKLRVEAKDQFTPIVNATYKLDDGEPLALTGIDDPGDGLAAVLGADEITFAKQPHKVEIVVSDRAGNSVTKTIDID